MANSSHACLKCCFSGAWPQLTLTEHLTVFQLHLRLPTAFKVDTIIILRKARQI